MAQWTSVCTHAGTDYGFASTCSIVQYAVSGTPLRPCIHVAMVTSANQGSPNTTRLRALAKQHPEKLSLVIYDPDSDSSMAEAVDMITAKAGVSGVNFIYTCPEWCEEGPQSGLADVTEDILRRSFHYNCVVPTFLSKLFYPGLQVASKANSQMELSRRRAGVVHMINERGILGDGLSETERGTMYGYSAASAAMVMSMKVMSYEFNKRNDNILVFGVAVPSQHSDVTYDVNIVRDKVSGRVHSSTGSDHGQLIHYLGHDVSY